EHKNQLDLGRATVAVDEKQWISNTAIEVSEVVRTFNRFVESNNLHTIWQCSFTAKVYADPRLVAHARRVCHLVQTTPPKWAGEAQSMWNYPEELRELRVGLYL